MSARWCNVRAVVLVGASALTVGMIGGRPVAAQEPPPAEQPPTTRNPLLELLFPTTTTAPPVTAPPTTAAPAAPGPADPGSPGSPAGPAGTDEPPADDVPAAGNGDIDSGPRIVPPEAQSRINSVRRSAPNDNSALVAGAQELEALGLTYDEAVNAAFGRFPIAGQSNWSDDWLMPRYTGSTFRYHLGLDIFAAYGTPVRASVDGIARISSSALGGLSVRVVEPDGTYYYLAHLSAVPDGLVDGQAVTTGAIVGFVGDSGNASGGSPHVHLAIHPRGGEPIPPKPIMDQYVSEAAGVVPEALAAFQAVQPRALVATNLVRQLAEGVARSEDFAASAPSRTELLFASSASPAGGGLQLADAGAATAAASVDWAGEAQARQAFSAEWQEASAAAWTIVAPLFAPSLGQVVEARRTGVVIGPAPNPLATAIAPAVVPPGDASLNP